MYFFSISEIISTRAAWRPPSKGVDKKASTISMARPGPTTRSPMASMLASLCRRVYLAEYVSEQTAQRMPGTLFAASEMPMPVPQSTMPASYWPLATASATFCP